MGILEGAINNSTTEAVAKQMRERCQVLIALGDCAVFGGVPTMRNAVASRKRCSGHTSRPKAPSTGRSRDHEDMA